MSFYSENIKINKKIANCILNSNKFLYSWYEGSAQTGKSVAAATSLALIIENAPKGDDIFLALGYTSVSAKNNIWNCGGYGVKSFYGSKCKEGKYKGQDCLKIKTKTGMKYLVAFGTSTQTANNVWHGWKVSAAIIDEVDRAHPNSIDEIQQRITAVDDPHIIFTQNPTDPNHKIYKFLDILKKKNLVYYEHFTLEDNPAFNKEKIEEIKNRYDPDSVFYKRYVLGLRIVAENNIYSIRDYNIINSFDVNDYINYIIVCDQGETVSSTAIVLIGFHKDKKLDILKHYKHRNADNANNPNFKFSTDYANDLADFVNDSIDLFNGRYPERVYIDRSESFWRECKITFNNKRINNSIISYVLKNNISERIKSGINLLYREKLRFFNKCDDVINDFKKAQYDPKESNKGILTRLKEYDDSGHNDFIDAVEYGFTHYIKLNKI